MKKARKKKTPRRKKAHFLIGSAMSLDRRQEPERRAFEIAGDYETCGACGTQKRRGLMCATCFCPRR